MTQERNPYGFRRFIAHAKYWAWWIITKVGLGIVCVGIISEGLRMFVPALGQKLYHLPGLAFLRNYEETHSLDIAPFLALFFMVAVWYLLEKFLHLWLRSVAVTLENARWDSDRETIVVSVLGVVLIGIDAVLFYTASTKMQWGGASVSISSILATIAYLSVLVFVSYRSAKLYGVVEELAELYELHKQAESENDDIDNEDPVS